MAYTKITGVYKIICSGNDKTYVGSAVSIKQRWASHICMLRKGGHGNKHLQNAWNKYGGASFEFQIIETCPLESLVETEQKWIDSLMTADQRFGMNNSPTASTSIGFKHSLQTRERLSAIAKAKDHSRLRAIAKGMIGKPAHNRGKPGLKWTPEMKLAASISRKGRPAWNLGIPMPDHVRKRVTQTLIAKGVGRKHSDATRDTIKALRKSGLSYPKISTATGVSTAQVYRIANGLSGGMRSFDKAKGVASK